MNNSERSSILNINYFFYTAIYMVLFIVFMCTEEINYTMYNISMISFGLSMASLILHGVYKDERRVYVFYDILSFIILIPLLLIGIIFEMIREVNRRKEDDEGDDYYYDEED